MAFYEKQFNLVLKQLLIFELFFELVHIITIWIIHYAPTYGRVLFDPFFKQFIFNFFARFVHILLNTSTFMDDFLYQQVFAIYKKCNLCLKNQTGLNWEGLIRF